MKQSLLIDLSNTRTKLAVTDGERILEKRHVATRDLDPDSLGKICARWEFGRVVLASVVPARAEGVRDLFGDRLLEVNAACRLGLVIDYPEPERIGADRLANAAALAAWSEGPAVAVDFGTAVTFDLIDEQPAYVGGVIAPGVDVMFDYLDRRTALLPRIDHVERVSPIGKSTAHAMKSGAFYGYVGMVREILLRLREELASARDLLVMATGGYADVFAAELPEISVVDPDLTMHGLRLIDRLND